MLKDEQVLTFILGPASVRSLFKAWPSDIYLSVLMVRDGNCEFSVFHEDDLTTIAPRMAKLLALPNENLVVVPECEGFPTTPFHFSDERRLLSLVASVPGIVEEAQDYAANVAYALEEGIDPHSLLSGDGHAAQFQIAGSTRNEDAASAETELMDNVAVPTFLRHGTAARIQENPPAEAPNTANATPIPVTVSLVGSTLDIHIPGGDGVIEISDPSEVFLRSDQQSIAFEKQMTSDTQAVRPATVRVTLVSLSQELAQRFSFGDCDAQLIERNGFTILELVEASQENLVSFVSARRPPVTQFLRSAGRSAWGRAS